MKPAEEIVVQKNVPAEMRDGTVLMSNVYRPAAGGPCPVLLTRLPYGKDLPLATTYLDPIKSAGAGYIVVIQDVRGRYRSEGKFIPFVHEFEDGYDTVEWAAKLPGSDGRVGMWGESYFGKTQWHAAVMRPTSLKAMAPGVTWGNHLNGAQMRGGVQELGAIQFWSQSALAPEILFRKYRDDPEQLQQKLPTLVGLIDTISSGAGYDVLPLTDLPDPDGLVPFMRGGFDRGVDDESWDYLNIDGRYDRVDAPTFHIGAWYDCFIGETLRQYEAMKEQAKQRDMRAPRLLVGPWTHGRFESLVGDLDFGLASSGLFLNYRGDLTDYHLRWFDATLKGDEEALEEMPPVEVFVMGENRWRGYEEWPVPGSREEHWYLQSGGNANTSSGDGGLSRERPDGADSVPDEYDYDPRNPVPTIGSATLLPPILRRGARDQRPNEEREDVLCYTSEVLEESYTVLGPVYVILFAASSAPDTDFVARLVDVYPDGRAIGVADGIVRASARESYPAPSVVKPTKPSPIEPDRPYEYVVDLWATGITFLAGHRIRVEITSSSFPRWERNLNTGESNAHSARTQVARQRIFHDPQKPSRITLTVVDS
ncbi:MAG: CocE/NonD family hydrolase [Actinomycetota bacterium]|nr:CocE/NonD family hydrolase [Actinomycetota bacterium]